MAFQNLVFTSMGTWDADNDGQVENIWRVRNYNEQAIKFEVDVYGASDPIEDYRQNGNPKDPLIVLGRSADAAYYEVFFYTQRPDEGANTTIIKYYNDLNAPVQSTKAANPNPFDFFSENPDNVNLVHFIPNDYTAGTPWYEGLSGGDKIQFPDNTTWGYDASVPFNAGAGNDTLSGGDLYDKLDGNTGDDLIGGDYGDDSLWGGDGNDSIEGALGNDSIEGGNDDDLLNGLEDDDLLVGGNGADIVLGVDGNDTGTGDAGNDILYGFAGADILEGGTDDDFIEGGADADTLDGGAGVNLVSYAGSAEGVTVNLATNVNAGGDAAGDLLYNFTRVLGSAHDDAITGNAAVPTEIVAQGGNDTVTGGSSIDVVYGNDGDDVVATAAGDDYVEGGTGNDSIDGGDGRDDIYAQDGNDTVLAGDSATIDLVLGGNGADSIDGQLGTDVLFGQGESDTLLGGAGDDWVQGGDGDDLLDGGDNPAGSIDWVTGGNGEDTLDGGTGNDWLAGGDDADRFVYSEGGAIDCIADFAPESDTLAIAGGVNGSGLASFQDLVDDGRIWSTGFDTIIDLGAAAGGAENFIQLVGVDPASLDAGNLVFVI